MLAVLAGWFVPSFFSAERYRRRLEAGLERKLMRPVTFDAMAFRLLPRPGFSIENVVVKEDPSFGAEPFVRVERIDCDLRWRSLWQSKLDFAQLHLERPTFNIVRNVSGEWNVENLLRKSGIASPANLTPQPPGNDSSPGNLDLEGDDARLNFKVGANKKPFTVTNLRARLTIERGRVVRFRLAGSPIRTDLALSTPGRLELAGEWIPGKDLDGPLDATLRTRGALLYNWVPLLTGHNPQIYGVFDSSIHLTGSLQDLKMEGQARLSQLHRWESLPPSDSMTVVIYLRGQFDRVRGRALFEGLDASFAGSRLHLSGSVENIPASPEMDLVVALERSRLEDLLALGGRLWGRAGSLGASGRADGLLTIQGPWAARRYGGFVGAREVFLRTSSGTFPVSEVALRIDKQGLRLAPVRITVAPRVEVVAEGALHHFAPPAGEGHRDAGPPSYEILLSMKAVQLRDFARFARGVRVRPIGVIQDFDLQGSGAATLRLAGLAWPPSPPTVSGHAELRAARLLVPGLTEPVDLTRARIQVNGGSIVVDPVVAAIGHTVFRARLEHQGERKEPWKFNVQANKLSLEQGSQWFDAFGHRAPLPLLERIPGLRTFAAHRAAGSNLFGALNAKGRFAAPAVTYRSITLGDFHASVEISGRVVRVREATFRAGGGRGQGSAQVDLASAPARVTADMALEGAKLQTFTSRFPSPLGGARGLLYGRGSFQTRGLTREELSGNLQGEATLRLKNVSLGDFDPLQAAARANSWGELEPSRGEATLRSAIVTLQVRDRRVILDNTPVEMSGAILKLTGNYGFNGIMDLDVHADFRHVTRRWIDNGNDTIPSASARVTDFHLTGPLEKLVIGPGVEVSRANQPLNH